MADMETNALPTTEDPVAEFLAREQSVLGDLEDDLLANKDGIDGATGGMVDPFLDSSAAGGGITQLNGEMNDLNGDFGEQTTNNLSNGISEMSLSNQNDSKMNDLPATMMSQQPIIPQEEPESIKRWREQHLKNLEAKDAEEKIKIEELRQQAKKELEEWYARYKEQLEAAKKQNRAAEKEWIAERDNSEPSGQSWEKISRLCDFNPKTSRNTRDTSRMRSMLLQLKQNPPASSSAAAVASGSSGTTT